jgi:hypothetical protein
MILSILSLVTACSALALQICIYRRMIRAEQKTEQMIEDIPPEPKNPDRYGLYDDFETRVVHLIGVDGFLYVVPGDPSKGVQRVFCEHELDFCTDKCMHFENAWNRDKTINQPNFQCNYLSVRYFAQKSERYDTPHA